MKSIQEKSGQKTNPGPSDGIRPVKHTTFVGASDKKENGSFVLHDHLKFGKLVVDDVRHLWDLFFPNKFDSNWLSVECAHDKMGEEKQAAFLCALWVRRWNQQVDGLGSPEALAFTHHWVVVLVLDFQWAQLRLASCCEWLHVTPSKSGHRFAWSEVSS